MLTLAENALRDIVISERREIAAGVVALVLEPATDAPLPQWTPGAHIELVLPSGLLRCYSLCGEREAGSYTIAVLREPDGHGGSEEVHTALDAGVSLRVRGPRNHFAFEEARSYLFIAGGIGITPILPMIREAARVDADWRLVFGGRTRDSMAFVDQLMAIDASCVTLLPENECGRPDLDGLLEDNSEISCVYACGPAGMLDALEQRCEERGMRSKLHLEHFTASAHSESAQDGEDNRAFEVVLRRSGLTVQVAADQSIYDAVCDVAPELPFSCLEGYCGTCLTTVLEGTPHHRDTVASPEEHDDEHTMILCVGRALSQQLVLDA